jgi:methanogenic corrinoid protein MtbC1
MQANSSQGGREGAGDNAERLSWVRGPVTGAGHLIDPALGAAKARVARLAKTIEVEVIPRLVLQHRDAAAGAAERPGPLDVDRVVRALVNDDDLELDAAVRALRERGVGVDSLCQDLLAPAAQQLGLLWEQDRVDFATVTVGLGRLQRLLRFLSPAFGAEVEHPPNSRRILLTQPDTEQHIFGLSMVAEFFRRAAWDVLGGVAGVGIDAPTWVRRDWFDVVGFSIGTGQSLPWLRAAVNEVREQSRNRDLVVLVGGPLFAHNPGWAEEVGADATADGRTAPQLAEAIVLRRAQLRLGSARIS